jgi:hypothetical protein
MSAVARKIAIALVHYPVLDAEGRSVTTAITNLDVHDLSRSARTYGAETYFLVHPIAAQRELVERICEHWRTGSSGKRIPDRVEALARARAIPSIEETIEALGGRANVEIWVTAARSIGPALSYADARARLRDGGDGRTVLVIFGTGWGLAQSVIDAADATLPPIRAEAETGYNHLSVRAACAITLDRLLGPS